MRRLRVVLLVFVVCLTASGQARMTVARLNDFLHNAIKGKMDDVEVAKYVRKIKLTERLDAVVIEDLQGDGLGPKTVQALKELMATTGSLPAPGKVAIAPKKEYVPPPPPNEEEQKRIIEGARDYALNYTAKLPDFICNQVTHRYSDPTGRESWRKEDEILERLSYYEHHEDYKVVMRNNQPVSISHDKLGGSVTSSGEFGSIMDGVFQPRTETEFKWARLATWDKRLTYVFTYHVEKGRSNYHMSVALDPKSNDTVSATPAYHGEVFIDKENLTVMKLTLQTEDLPADFPVKEAKLVLVYDKTKIGEYEFVLPHQAVLTSRGTANYLTKNNIDFVMYRKFGADTAIQFDTPEPLPEQKEQPVK